MLVEFSVENFKSFGEKQTLNLIAGSDDTHSDNLIHAPEGLPKSNLLRSAVIYGANASGKSNLIEAVSFMKWYITNCVNKPEAATTGVIPNFLLAEWRDKPTTFEAIFVSDNIRYQYGFSLDRKRIWEEWLFAYPNQKLQRWFEREYDPETQQYAWEFGTHLKGEKKRLVEFVRQDLLFLSIATQFNHKQLTDIYKWFEYYVISEISPETVGSSLRYKTKAFASCSEDIRAKVKSMLKYADVGIDDFLVKEQHVPKGFEIAPDDPPLVKQIKESMGYRIITTHKAADGSRVEFAIDDESVGTQRLLELSLPWIKGLQDGQVVFVDELDRSMHPLLVRAMVGMFHNPEINLSNAQLVFSTHDTTILQQEIFRRDQIWFIEKTKEGYSDLYSLWEFSPRKDESLEKGYLHGRYGAIPFLSDFSWDD